jgi:signal transduction histidine kinase
MFGERVYSWMRRHELFVDCATAFVLALSCVLFGLVVRADAAYFVLSLALLAPLAVRRRQPVWCAAVVLAVALLQWLSVRDTTAALPADLAIPIVIYGAAAYAPAWASRVAIVAGLIGAGLGGLSWPRLAQTPTAHAIIGGFLASVVIAAWAVGTLQRVRRNQLASLAERARLLEVERDQRDQLAVLAERTRIAREMHDVVAHSLAVLVAQADGGRYASSPDDAKTALTTISDYARQALAETRRVLGVLREPAPATEVRPQPGIDDVPLLVDRVRESGLDVRLTLEQPKNPVEPGLALAAYRIVQEGLTNVIKHAGPSAHAEVSLRWKARSLEIEVLDDGRTTMTQSGGYGVMGMRERASAYGGTVTLKPRPGGGKILSARIPL